MAEARKREAPAGPASVHKPYPLRSFAAGAAAGAIDTVITMPLDTIKTQMQIKNHPSVAACARTIVRHDGLLGLYYGFPPFLLQASGKAAVRFCMFDVLIKLVDKSGADRARNPAMWSGACGLGAGMAEALFWTAPTERLKVLRQARAGQGKTCVPPSVSSIIRERGVRDLYVGAGATAARQASSVAMRFCFLEEAKTLICRRMGYEKVGAPAWVTFLSGGIGGFVSAVSVPSPRGIWASCGELARDPSQHQPSI
jgi:hypothetical protein